MITYTLTSVIAHEKVTVLGLKGECFREYPANQSQLIKLKVRKRSYVVCHVLNDLRHAWLLLDVRTEIATKETRSFSEDFHIMSLSLICKWKSKDVSY